MNRVSILVARLQARGWRMTSARRVLLEILSDRHDPLSVSDILSAMRAHNLTPNKTTVYRELERLKEEGVIREVLIDGKSQYIELVDEESHHHHVICTKCKRIEDFDPPADIEKRIDELTGLVERKAGFVSVSHAVDFFGTCPRCARKT